MKTHGLLICLGLFLLVPRSASGQTPPYGRFLEHFTISVEWGYTQGFFQSRNYNYISEEGYRVFEDKRRFQAVSNAQIQLHFGYRLNERTNLAICGGYMGMGKDNRLLPLTLRLSFFPSTDSEDGMFTYAQGGVAWHIHTTAGRMAALAAIGGGYRFRLGYYTNLDLLIGIKYLRDHPSIPNPEGPGNVPEHKIRMNNAGYCALDVSIAVSF